MYELNPLKKEEESGTSAEGTASEGQPVQQLVKTSDVMTPGGEASVSELGTGQGAAPTGGVDIGEQQKYFQANLEKSKLLGNQTAGVIKGDINQAQAALKSAQESYQTGIGKATVGLNQDLYNKATQSLLDQNSPGYTEGAATAFAQSPEGEAFKKQYGAEFKGVDPFIGTSEYGEASRLSDRAVKSGEMANTEEGRRRLIERSYNSPYGRFSSGTTALDESLLMGNTSAYEELLGAARQAPTLTEQRKTAQEEAQKAYDKGAATTASTKDAYRNQFNFGNEVKELEQKAAGIKTKAQTDFEAFLDSLTKKEDVGNAQYGGTIKAGAYYDPVNATEYENINAQNVASKEDYARLAALSSLTGGQEGFLGGEGQAGQYSKFIDPNSFYRKEDYDKAVGASLKQEGEMKALEVSRAEAQAAENARIAQEEAASKKKSQATTAGTLVGAGVGAYFGGTVGAAVGAAVGGAVGSAAGEVVEGVAAVGHDVIAGVGSAAPQITQAIGQVPQQVGGAVSSGLQNAGGAVSNTLQQVGQGVAAAPQQIINTVAAAPAAVVNAVGSGLNQAGGAVSNTAKAVVAPLATVACFSGDSEFLMCDGSYKKIKDIMPGDVMSEGGEVSSTMKHLLREPIYMYTTDLGNFVLVTGNHAIKEDGIWKRVEHSEKAIRINDHSENLVYSLNNVNHIMLSRRIVFADDMEFDCSENIPLDACLKILNAKANHKMDAEIYFEDVFSLNLNKIYA